MIDLTKVIFTSFLLYFIINQVYTYSEPVPVPKFNVDCPNDFARTCDLICPDGNYLTGENGCPKCACKPNDRMPKTTCPEIKCRANCGDDGYELDENGCQTCKCVKSQDVQCSRVMCRMFCQYGFKRDENGCEYCACNDFPQECPKLKCVRNCENGYRKDYSNCQTCECNEQQDRSHDRCLPLTCDLNCEHGFQRDESGCQICTCNRCPVQTCRMYCMFGFRRNNDGCEICECDWTPVAEKIQCSERISCSGTRVCNMQLKLCEIVDPDRVNWFLYDFEIENEQFMDDPKFIQTFKNGLIHNIAKKYGLEITQIVVSSVQSKGLTSFHIMPFFNENMEEFEKKMDNIDIDLNSHEFRKLLPAVVRVIEDDDEKNPPANIFGQLCTRFRNLTHMSIKSMFGTTIVLIAIISIIVIVMRCNLRRQQAKHWIRSESKTPIYETSYHQAPTEEDHYYTGYPTVDINGIKSSNDKQAFV